jgi:hypothetical protein
MTVDFDVAARVLGITAPYIGECLIRLCPVDGVMLEEALNRLIWEAGVQHQETKFILLQRPVLELVFCGPC